MSAIRLLVLGAVRRRGRAHGYQIRSDLEASGAHEWSTATSGSIYHALKSMTTQGLLRMHDTGPSDAGGPPRTEYELTPQGEDAFFTMLRDALSSRDPRLDLFTAAVGHLDDLSRDEAIALLRIRADAMDAWQASITAHIPPGTDLDTWGPIGEVLRLWLHTAETRAEWTRRLIRRLEDGAFQMAGET